MTIKCRLGLTLLLHCYVFEGLLGAVLDFEFVKWCYNLRMSSDLIYINMDGN